MSTEIATPSAGSALANILADSKRIADIDVDKLERLAELHMQMLARDSEIAYGIAMNAAQSELKPVTKRAVNSHTGSKYALLEDIERMLDPIIHRHGFSVSSTTGTSDKPDHTKYVAVVRHVGGHVTTHELEAPYDDKGAKGQTTKTRIHGMKSSRSYCKRILKTEIFDVTTTKDDDGNAAAGVGPSAETITPDQAADLRALIEEVGANDEAFRRVCKVDRWEELPASRFRPAIQRLEMKRASQ